LPAAGDRVVAVVAVQVVVMPPPVTLSLPDPALTVTGFDDSPSPRSLVAREAVDQHRVEVQHENEVVTPLRVTWGVWMPKLT
jgi:hypothetical protein